MTVASRSAYGGNGTDKTGTVVHGQELHLPGALGRYLHTDIIGSKLRHFRLAAKTVGYLGFHLALQEVDKVGTVHSRKQRAQRIGHIGETSLCRLRRQRANPHTYCK